MVLNIKSAQQDTVQSDLFGPSATIHQVVTELGALGAVNAGQLASLGANPTSLTKVLAGRTGRQIADTASQALIREIEKSGLRGYSYSAWCLAGLPHRDLPAGDDWLIETDFARLLVRPGVRLRDDNTREALRVPMGSFARLLLIDWQTEALENGSREISMGKSATAVAARLGAGRGGPSNAKVIDQLERLANCSIDFAFGNDRKGTIVNQRLVEASDFVSEPETRSKSAGPRMIERILLSQPFFDELRRHPVLVDRAAIRDLTSSPLAIDIYLWLAFRLHSLEKETPIPWERLWKQFGPRVAKLKNFRPQFEAPLHLALSAYSAAKVRVSDRGLLLEPSPPPVAG